MPGPGSILGDAVSQLIGGVLDQVLKSVWNGAQALLRGSFTLADQFTTFSLSDGGGGLAPGSPLGAVWPVMKWVAVAVAVGLFFTQVTLTAVRGGRGMFRAVTGPLQFGLALALTVGGVGALLAATDGLTTVLLQTGLSSGNFSGVLDAPAVASRIGATPDLGVEAAEEQVRAMVLAVAALFGFIPASFSFALLMIFRQAAVLVLVATSPITAAGLLADATSVWFWRALRWMIAAALIKPTLALILVVGINMMSASTGISGLIAGAAVLLISVFAPMTLYRLMAFVDPSTGAGQAIRRPSLSQGSDPSSDGGDTEATNTARFADAPAGSGAGGAGSASGGAGAGGGAAGGAAGGGAAGGGAASGGAAAAAGPAAAAVAAVGMARRVASAGNTWSNNQMSGFAVGHAGGGPGAAPRRGRGGPWGPQSSDDGSDDGGGGGGGAGGDEGAVGTPPDDGPVPGSRWGPRDDDDPGPPPRQDWDDPDWADPGAGDPGAGDDAQRATDHRPPDRAPDP